MYRGTFKNINNDGYTVEIIPKGTEGHVDEITLSANPVTISRKSESLFSEIKPLSCTIEIMTDKILPNLYSKNLKDVTVNVYNRNLKVFSGYLTPYIYSQPYANVLDILQLEAVSKLSVLKDINYTPVNGGLNKSIVSFKDIIWHILTDGAGYDENTLRVAYRFGTEQSLNDFKISESNFYDDDDEKTPWKMDEVLTHICRYLGVSCIEFEDDWIYLLDYQQIANSTSFNANVIGRNVNTVTVTSKCAVCGYTVTYYDIPQQCSSCGQSGTMQKVDKGVEDSVLYEQGIEKTRIITKDDFKSNDSSISYDDIYNKAEVEVNGYELEELCPDLFDEKNNHHMVSYGGNSTIIVNNVSLSGNVTHQVYQTKKLANANTNWKHYFYRMSDGTELYDYEDYYGSNYNYLSIPHINTRCAVITQVASKNVNEVTPVKIDFSDYITFYCLDDTTAPHGDYNFSWKVKNGNITDTSGNIRTPVEQPVLEYTSDDPIKWCPESGTSWITIKGDLWYQSNWAFENTSLYVANISNQSYAQFPYDGLVSGAEPYIPAVSTTMSNNGTFYTIPAKNGTTMWMAEREPSNADYGKGFPMLKCKLQIGDYYWDADYQGWTTAESTFYINYNNAPNGDINESFACFQWQSIAPNHTYEDKIGEKCWAIPIKESVDGHKVTGKLKFTLYTPSQLGPLYDRWNTGANWQVLFPVIYMKDFELNYVYTDDSQWWKITEDKNDDLVYSNSATNSFNREYDAVEFKINSYSDNVPISKSFVLKADNTFMGDVQNYDTNSTYNMEKHYIEKILNHYQDKKLIYEATIEYGNSINSGNLDPRLKYRFDFDSVDTFKNGDELKTFLVDSFELNLRENTAKVKFIEW